jgi:uncharacterized protein YjiS (DUF1127 family)
MVNLKNIRFGNEFLRGISTFPMEQAVSSVFQETPMTHHAGNGAFGSTFTLALVGVAVRAIRQFAMALKNRAEVRHLHELDDRALKDIGLMRTDIHAALDMPLYRDPSRHLVDVAGVTRSRRPATQPAAVSSAGAMRLRRTDAPVKAGMAANTCCA